jgi:hypothetical protein
MISSTHTSVCINASRTRAIGHPPRAIVLKQRSDDPIWIPLNGSQLITKASEAVPYWSLPAERVINNNGLTSDVSGRERWRRTRPEASLRFISRTQTKACTAGSHFRFFQSHDPGPIGRLL